MEHSLSLMSVTPVLYMCYVVHAHVCIYMATDVRALRRPHALHFQDTILETGSIMESRTRPAASESQHS